METNGHAIADIDAEETRDWLDSLDSVVRADGAERARFLIQRLLQEAGRVGASPPLTGPTPYTHQTVRTPLPYGSPSAPACVASLRTFEAMIPSGNAGTVTISCPS